VCHVKVNSVPLPSRYRGRQVYGCTILDLSGKRGWVVSSLRPWRLPSGGKRPVNKAKFALEQAVKAQRRSRGVSLLFFNLGARWSGWSSPLPGLFAPGKETRYPLYRMLAGPQGRPRRVRKISPPTGIRSRYRPARSESLYRLPYPGTHCNVMYVCYS